MENKTPADLTAIVLTYNEEQHIQRCLDSIKSCVKRIVAIDSYSTDNTLNILKKNNIEVFQKKYINLAIQFNWGIKIAEIKTKWILRIDSDEFIPEKSAATIGKELESLSPNISGIIINRRGIFLGKEIKFGGAFPQKVIRIWKNGKGKIHDIWCDEHVLVNGESTYINQDIVDDNLNDLNWWITKHKKFAKFEAINYFLHTHNKNKIEDKSFDRGKNEKMKFFLKYKIYYSVPTILRPILLFIYKYFFRFGFLDGWKVLRFHYLQSFWYRFLVDLNILKIKKIMKKDGLNLSQTIKKEFDFEI